MRHAAIKINLPPDKLVTVAGFCCIIQVRSMHMRKTALTVHYLLGRKMVKGWSRSFTTRLPPTTSSSATCMDERRIS